MSEIVTAEELAAKLNGREYRDEMNDELRKLAKDSGLVVVYGASDDLIEFDGAASEEYSLYGGGNIPVGKDGEPIFGCDEPCNHCSAVEDAQNAKQVIMAEWNSDGYSWRLMPMGISPYAPFDILEDGEKYCRGIVFNLKDLH